MFDLLIFFFSILYMHDLVCVFFFLRFVVVPLLCSYFCVVVCLFVCCCVLVVVLLFQNGRSLDCISTNETQWGLMCLSRVKQGKCVRWMILFCMEPQRNRELDLLLIFWFFSFGARFILRFFSTPPFIHPTHKKK